MESLQLAQMLADLSSLNETEPPAASALLNATKSIDEAIEKVAGEKPQAQRLMRPDLGRTCSSVSTPGPFDRLGKHVFGSQPPTRPSSVSATAPGTPVPHDIEDDVDKASTLIALQEIRAKLKQQDNTSLMKAREKVNALAARQQALESNGKSGRKPRYTYPK
ncbi:uncharacterized protein DNG_03629 [Cephalotrichum gorgonifer]|uniref:Uncharacterized protein n=1 Tax=Cephalotrichum gorgonifer TaxID=2041049 RepID=A0AAE8STS5_9PEZI|nr:uncharacterized protein DNG_03629 [Cephalotrichum gorgonifer]